MLGIVNTGNFSTSACKPVTAAGLEVFAPTGVNEVGRSVPFPFGKERKRDLGLSDDDLAVVKKRAADDDLCVMGLRFTGDKMSPPERFQRLHEELGDNFVGVEIDSSPGNPHGNPKMAHSVLTEHLVDEVGHPTRDALGQVLELFSSRLLVKQ